MAEEKELSPSEIEAKKKLEEYRKIINGILKESCFNSIDDRRYSFVYDKKTFTFRIPTLLEKTRIKSILSQIAYNENGIVSSSQEIDFSGDLDLRCSAKLVTNMSVLLDKIQDNTNIENIINGPEYIEILTDDQQFELGYRILICENEFLEGKKKVS